MNSEHDNEKSSAATPVDSGSQALAEALRSSFVIVKFVMAVLLAVFLFSGFFTVGPQEKAIKLRFGKPVGEGDQALLGAGPHWAWPYPIDEIVKVPITEIQKVTSTVGWYATTREQELAGTEPLPGPSLNPATDGYALTADGNIVHVRATVSYRVEDPIRCVFGFAGGTNDAYGLTGTSNAMQNAVNNAVLATTARFKVDDILTRDQLAFQEAVGKRVAELIERQKLGVAMELCVVQSRPPRWLDEPFRNVVRAELNRAKALDDARSYANQATNRASADAVAITNLAVAERTRRLSAVVADAKRFEGLLPRYEENQTLFVQQRLLETMARVLTNVQEKAYIPTSADGKPVELRLLLNRELGKPKAEETKP